MDILLFNPLSLVRPGRAEEISKEIENMDLVFLPGTRRRNAAVEAPVVQHKVGKHMEYAWGRRNTGVSNR